MAKIVITGANRGIGLQLAKLRADDHEVIAIVRRSSEELAALRKVRVEDGVDVTDPAAIARVAERLDGIDVLINNAGILRRGSLDDLDVDDIRSQLEVNAIGPLLLSAALVHKIRRGGKVVFVTSRMGSIADNTSGGSYGYRMSKAALNMAATSFAHDVRGREIAVQLVHPGYVRTEMTGGTGHVGPDEAARMIWERTDELGLEESGRFVHANGEPLPW
ncbi:MAG: SDR family oxidoreductase [Sandaracinaceae bacterium]